VSDFDDGAVPAASPIAELASHPDAARWARDCAWVPGTGHCRNRPCCGTCLFRAQREAEALRLRQSRRLRRRAQQRFASRMVRRILLFLVVLSLVELV